MLERLFTLANALADQEASSDYAGIAQVQGRDSCSFLEHLGELPPAGQIGLLRALIKRRFAMEGFRPSEMALSMSEQLEVNHWLKHNNSMHGTRPTEFFASSLREEEFKRTTGSASRASPEDIRTALRNGLGRVAARIQVARDSKNEFSWFVRRDEVIVEAAVDFRVSSGAQAEALVLVREAGRLLNAPFSFLRLLGIGATDWTFLQRGQESLYASATTRFFMRVLEAMQ